MSVENIKPYNKYQGNGVANEFSIDFPYNNKNDVKVYLKNEGENQQTLAVDTDYSWINDKTIRLNTAPANGSILAIYRETPLASDYNFANQSRLFPEEVTKSDDVGILLIQEVDAKVERSLILDETSTATPEELVDELRGLVSTTAGYVDQASNYADTSKDWATKTNGPVSGGEYSSKYYAEQIIPIASDIASVVGNATNINTVASNISDINSCASNMPSIQDAQNQAQAAANSAELAAQYGNDKINQTHISNCITYIPQDIKLELNNGTLTLKAGSKVYMGDGAFSPLTITNNINNNNTSLKSTKCFIHILGTSTTILPVENYTSGPTLPTSVGAGQRRHFNTTDNKFYQTQDGGATWTFLNISLPFCIVTKDENGVITSINKVFNGTGYIGSEQFFLPNYTVLTTNGKNDDGTNNNRAYTFTSVVTYNRNLTGNNIPVWVRYNGSISFSTGVTYDEKTNTTTPEGYAQIGTVDLNAGVISNFNMKNTFHALDYNDTEFIGHQAMPSDKYIDLTLLASGQTYTAPADGYFYLNKTIGTNGNTKIEMYNSSTGLRAISPAGSLANNNWLYCSIYANKGDSVQITYTITGTTNEFKFIYTNGSK